VSERGPHEQLLQCELFIDGASRAFGTVTLEQARARAEELRAVCGWGPTMRVLPVARAWRELTIAMELNAVGSVAELDVALVVEIAQRLGVTMSSAPMMR
jgi:hypothetical protein